MEEINPSSEASNNQRIPVPKKKSTGPEVVASIADRSAVNDCEDGSGFDAPDGEAIGAGALARAAVIS